MIRRAGNFPVSNLFFLFTANMIFFNMYNVCIHIYISMEVAEFAYRKPGSSCWIAPWCKLANSHGLKGIACVVAMGFDRAHARCM